ncbi:hypothetical protein LZP73_06280 [Shewanella sp. AS16]|uniref:hypothetical protein n=1 Tax=Shewanella sp. AS16 TaxID=2907625 RepID=UPI001F3E27E0|nr:hypothetical protein [Shewanella sp. AS16]MCE9685824.1 hypothetical protein [Shewanella sp. AS16]
MNNNGLYFPSLHRQSIESYYSNKGTFYSTYNCNSNYVNISNDCQNRCVYCDVLVDECGGEPLSLDHFRPINVFGDKFDGILKFHPYNLYLSCQKCNVLKSNDWKGCVETIDGPAFINAMGYVDRFKVDVANFFDVTSDGLVVSVDNAGPADYMIGKLLLNRTNRVYIRLLRQVKLKASMVHEILTENMKSSLERIESGRENDLDLSEVKALVKLLERFNKLNLMTK